jgi:hypothetical protein
MYQALVAICISILLSIPITLVYTILFIRETHKRPGEEFACQGRGDFIREIYADVQGRVGVACKHGKRVGVPKNKAVTRIIAKRAGFHQVPIDAIPGHITIATERPVRHLIVIEKKTSSVDNASK